MTPDDWLTQAGALGPSDRARLASRLLALQDGDPGTARRWMETAGVQKMLESWASRTKLPDDPQCCFCGRSKQWVEQLVGLQDVFLCGECCHRLAGLVSP